MDVLTKGGDLCDAQEDGTFVIVGDGSDEDEDEDIQPESQVNRPAHSSPYQTTNPNSQVKQTQGQQQSPHDSDSATEIAVAEQVEGDSEQLSREQSPTQIDDTSYEQDENT